MTKGFFLYHLDKTTCGGRILAGASDDTYEIGGIERQKVRAGDPVTCGKHEGRFRVCGGMGDTYEVGGELKEWAGSLDSYSSCPCRARFIPAVETDTYESDCNAGRVAEREKVAKQTEQREKPEEMNPAPVPVFAKSCLRGAGCNDAGTAEEPQENFATMSFYQSQPVSPSTSSASSSAPASDSEPEQHAQTAKKKKTPIKRHRRLRRRKNAPCSTGLRAFFSARRKRCRCPRWCWVAEPKPVWPPLRAGPRRS